MASATFKYAAVAFAFLGATQSANAEDVREVGNDWTWFTDYVFLYSQWSLSVQEGCECEAGVGVKVGGKPRGEKRRFNKHVVMTTIGIGAIHVRTLMPGERCRVRLDQGNVGLMPVI